MAGQIGLAAALVGGGALMVSKSPLLMVGPVQFFALVFWIVIGGFAVSIEARLPLETRQDPPELLNRRYSTQRGRLAAMRVAYQMYQATALVLVLVSVKFWLDFVAHHAVHHSWG
ncbi:hypothetical protein [Enhygromyxa salina]|uniref:hypothetical protein n=1 Tax=Enhygromyxa salina TaxID=215803 RepID=UPI000D03A1F4|nr:hypothetical protein [Enhygromyxa salina]